MFPRRSCYARLRARGPWLPGEGSGGAFGPPREAGRLGGRRPPNSIPRQTKNQILRKLILSQAVAIVTETSYRLAAKREKSRYSQFRNYVSSLLIPKVRTKPQQVINEKWLEAERLAFAVVAGIWSPLYGSTKEN